MKVNPINLKAEGFQEFLNLDHEIEVGDRNFDDEKKSETHEIHHGKIIKVELAGNYPHLPAKVIFQRSSGMIEEISLGRLLTIQKIDASTDE